MKLGIITSVVIAVLFSIQNATAQDYIDLDDPLVLLQGGYPVNDLYQRYPYGIYLDPNFVCRAGQTNYIELRYNKPLAEIPTDKLMLSIIKSGLAMDINAGCRFSPYQYPDRVYPFEIKIIFPDGQTETLHDVTQHVNFFTGEQYREKQADLKNKIERLRNAQ